ncbi:hypothetical protein [Vibrio coralliilyticus]|uniref:hypothetical protein n=1 Tax=Vibrio coralliilyticus TaxID=190893 RepID=UPI0017BE3CF9|nr:hypothetical protein [Vibrio coralliilyticus]MCC2525728.1 hypothetical protein [Vibrio coralliilyticus]NUW67177.1 hypothetical protein [Vibrio coralliilyticus]
MLDTLFPHIGELVLEKILKERPELVAHKLGIEVEQVVSVHRQLPIFFPESDVMFDGFSTIDLAIELKDGIVLPIEVKLGKTGLAKASVDKMLSDCSISSHTSEKRISGKVFSILNRNYDTKLKSAIGESILSTKIDGRTLALSDSWGIIARSKIISSWQKLPPNFNSLQTYLSVNEICCDYGENNFNRVVTEILSGVNFYDEWLV